MKSPPKLEKNNQSAITYRSPKKWVENKSKEDLQTQDIKSPKRFK